jgi:hypothetical protein
MGHIDVVQPSEPQTWWDQFLEDAGEWAEGKMWIPRALLLAVLVYIEILKIHDNSRWTIFYGITLGFHELGHLLTGWTGQFICALMGSVFQVAVPIAVIVIFYQQPDYFGMSVGGFWLSYSLFELAAYVGDARAQDLPLVGFASQEDLQHDWHYILGQMHMLSLDTTFAFFIRVAAVAAGCASLAFAVWLLLRMARSSRS